jgi:hypothetical protein
VNLNLPATPGLLYAALISPSGHLLASLGQSVVDPAISAVLAQGAMAALSDLSQRSQAGNCTDITATCDNGGILVMSDPSGHVVLMQHAPGASLEHLRLHGRAMLVAAMNPPQAKPQGRQSLMEALNAAPP